MESLGILGPNLLFQIVNFVILLWLLNRFLYRPVLKLMEERRESIRRELEAAERAREEAAVERQRLLEEMQEERRQSEERLRKVVEASEAAAQARLEEAQREAARILAEAERQAEAMRRQSLAALRGDMADLALLAAAKVLQEGLDEERHRQLVDRFLREEIDKIR